MENFKIQKMVLSWWEVLEAHTPAILAMSWMVQQYEHVKQTMNGQERNLTALKVCMQLLHKKSIHFLVLKVIVNI